MPGAKPSPVPAALVVRQGRYLSRSMEASDSQQGGWYILDAETGDPAPAPSGPFATEDEAREVHGNAHSGDPLLVVRWVETP